MGIFDIFSRLSEILSFCVLIKSLYAALKRRTNENEMGYRKGETIYFNGKYYLLKSLLKTLYVIYAIDFSLWYILYETQSVLYTYYLENMNYVIIAVIVLLLSIAILGEDIFLYNFMIGKKYYYMIMAAHALISLIMVCTIKFSSAMEIIILLCFFIVVIAISILNAFVLWNGANSLKIQIKTNPRDHRMNRVELTTPLWIKEVGKDTLTKLSLSNSRITVLPDNNIIIEQKEANKEYPKDTIQYIRLGEETFFCYCKSMNKWINIIDCPQKTQK